MTDEPTPARQGQIADILFVKIPYAVAGTLFLFAAALNIVNIVGRYVFGAPIFWAEEILIFTMIWAVFVIAVTVTYRGAHLRMDLIYSAFPRPLKVAVNILITICFLVCMLFTAMQSWNVVALHYKNGAVTAGTDIPLVIPHAAVLFGFLMMAVAVLVRLRAYISGRFE